MQTKKITHSHFKPYQYHIVCTPIQNLQGTTLATHSRGRQITPNTLTCSSLGVPHSHSANKSRKNSKNKLFEKAHHTAQGETYLKDGKRQHPLPAHEITHTSTVKTLAEKTANLAIQNHFDMKINAETVDGHTSFSRLVMEYDCPNGFLSVDLSSINEDGYQTASDFSVSQSLLREIASK